MQIGIIGREVYTKYLKNNLNSSYKIKQLQDGDALNNSHFKYLDVLISMTWGKSIWGGKKKVTVPIAPKLKLLQLPGSGIDGVNFSLLPKKCKVCNVYEHEVPISEYVLSNILNFEIGMLEKITKFKKNNWNDSLLFSQKGHGELFGKNVGILGYGRIGKEIAKRIKVFNTNITGISRKPKKNIAHLDQMIHYSKLKEALPKMDYLIISCDLNETTINMISEKNISLMKKTAVIVNIARGPILNEKAIFNALEKNKIKGAIIDTWYKYPNRNNKDKYKPSIYNFNKLKNVIMTPHLSCMSSNMLERRFDLIKSNIISLKTGKKLKNLVQF